jgi:hypothetical protein
MIQNNRLKARDNKEWCALLGENLVWQEISTWMMDDQQGPWLKGGKNNVRFQGSTKKIIMLQWKNHERWSHVPITKREGRELEKELCRNTETTRHGERTDPN